MNHALTPLPWQRELWLELTAQVQQGRLAHALLLTGPRGVGKRRFAVALTAFLLCEARGAHACGACRSCRQIAVGAHPNANLVSQDGLLGLAATATGRHPNALVHWEPDDKSKRRDITIDAARHVMERFELTSHYGQAKIALIDPADELNQSSVNALLKTVEEPPANTHLLLVSERPQGLAATLRSRCQRLRFAAPDTADALAWLAEAGVRDAAAALAAANGAPLLAAQWAEAGALDQHREWAELWTAVVQRKRDPLAAAATVPREDLAALLDWLLRWLTAQLRDALSARGAGVAAPALARMAQEALEARRRLDGNANPQLLLEALLIEWARLTRAQIG